MCKKNVLIGVLLAMLLLVSSATADDTFSLNFYMYPWPWVSADYHTITLNTNPEDADQSAGFGDWLTNGWEDIEIPWEPSAPQDPCTITSNQGSEATFTLTDARNGGGYFWPQPRTTLLGDGNGDMMDGHANATEDEDSSGQAIVDMTVSDIPFAVYDVIFYIGSQEAQFGDGTGKFVFNGGAEQDFTLTSGIFNGTFTEIVDATTPGNYILYEGVKDSSFTVQMWGNGFNHIGLCGFQFRQATPALAGSPDPADGATDVCRKVVLSWRSGEYADKHDVYFGTDFDDVNDATTTVDPNNVYQGRQYPNRYPIAETLSLDFGETYYWRIDEVNASPDYTIFKGGIWQFTTEPFAYPIAGDEITATASSSKAADQGPENTINGSGLDANDLHSTVPTDMWLSGSHQPGEAWIQYELDNVYKLHEMWVWNHNSGMEDTLGYGLKDVTIEYSENGADYTTLDTTHEFARAPGTPGYEHNTEVYFGVPAKYVKLTANSNWEGKFDKYGLSEVRFFRIPVRPGEESPESGTTIDGIDVVLSWRPGREAAEHNVYFSASFEDVSTGTIAPDIIDAADGCRASYGPLSLDLGKTYYWKVNEVNLAEEPSTWEGDVWNFTTPEYLVVDDMEAYTGRQSIRAVWHDGYVAGIAPSGSNVTVSTESDDRDPRLAGVGPPWPVRGSEAMQFAYDNDGSITLYVQPYAITSYSANANYYSEIAASTSGPNSLEIGQDWASAKALSLWFYGDPNNAAEQMYVKLNGSKVVYDGDAGDVQQAGWQQWNIALSDFGVDLQNVTMVYIGFGDENNTTSGGSGVVFFDDIRLYPTHCVLSKRSPDFARVDYVEDCVVDYKELDVMAADWLAAGVAPGSANLVSWWKLDGNANDSAGTNHGTLMGGPQWVSEGYDGGALEFDGTDDYVNIDGYKGITATNDVQPAFSIACWLKTNGDGTMVSWGSGDGTPVGGQYLTFRIDGGRLRSEHGDGNLRGNTYVDDGEWHHCALTVVEGGNLRVPNTILYVDGQEDTVFSGSDNIYNLTADANVSIGRQAHSDDRFFDGIIDDVRIYNAVLSEAEVAYLGLSAHRANLYEDMKIDFKDFAELAAWWLDEVLWP